MFARIALLLIMITCPALAAPAPAPAHILAGRVPTDANTEITINIKLLDAPASRRRDPRANLYIIDHLAPGATIRRRVEVANQSTFPLRIEVYPAAASVQGNTFSFAPGRTQNELATWTTLDKAGADLRAGGTAIVTVTIAVPQNASAGERYAVIWAQAAGSTDAEHNVAIVSRVGVRVYLDVGPGGEPASDFQIDSLTPIRTPDGYPAVTAQVRNTGGRAIDLSGTLTLSNGPGGVSAGQFTAKTGTTLARGGSTSVLVPLSAGLPNGPWTADLTLRSGLLTRTARAVITFPDAVGATGRSTPIGLSSWRSGKKLTGLLMLILVPVGTYLTIRQRRTRRRT